jgi:uncharacterized protein YjbJ (UPF0337 family)
MANDQHAKGQGEKMGGKVEEGVGKATGDRDMQREGKADQAKGSARKAAGDAKDALKK